MNINIEKDKDITSYTTFGIKTRARYFAEYSSETELLKISRSHEFLENEVLHIGGGSNLVFMGDFDGLILHSGIVGIREYRKDSDTVYAIAGAGVKWIDFVDWCVDHDLAGVENLAGIPGEVGASPVQNVGAYGAEAADVIHNVECFDLESRKTVVFSNAECRFGYRDSFFKHQGKGRYIVLRVSFKLRPSNLATNLTYGPLRDLKDRLGYNPTIRDVAEEVKKIRNAKLPDPEILGSSGSFFKNPVVSTRIYGKYKVDYPDMPGYDVADNPELTKLSAAWLIDKCGLKGLRVGDAEVYPHQPLVIVNSGNATGQDVRSLADEVILRVRSKFYVSLKPEANFIDTSMKITMLGSGTSKGVPEVGCICRVCSSSDSRDKRLRASILVETHGLRILVDPSADFREQAIRARIADIDAVLVTHSHYDHVGGFDDLRPFCGVEKLPVYLRKDVNDDLHRRLDYCFRPHPYPGVPEFDMIEIDATPFFINGLRIEPVEVLHGQLPILGYRFGKFAYVTDCKTLPEESIEKLQDIDVLILNGLRFKPHFAHLSIPEAVELIEKLKPKEAWLTHFNHEIGLHDELEARLPDNIHAGYDGLEIYLK